MILGESGTGKETVALRLHYGSRRYEGKFVAFNCATVNPQLIESRLFGYEKGAVTGADKQKPGLLPAVVEKEDGKLKFLSRCAGLAFVVTGAMSVRLMVAGAFKYNSGSSCWLSLFGRIRDVEGDAGIDHPLCSGACFAECGRKAQHGSGTFALRLLDNRYDAG